MTSRPDNPAGSERGEASALDPALSDALRAVLGPLARLALARGMSCAAMEELLKEAFVEEARKAQTVQTHARMISRISVATGLNRREVTRLTRAEPAPRNVRQPPGPELFARWMTDSALRDGDGPRVLPRLPAESGMPNFEDLAHSVTRDVHPRSLLEELCRLGVARYEPDTDTVHLCKADFVPGGDHDGMLDFLGDNVGDHLGAAVDNVLAPQPPHFEQAVFADELSVQALAAVKAFVGEQWHGLLRGAVPLLEDLIADDRKAGRRQDRRVRIGIYSYTAALPTPETESEQ